MRLMKARILQLIAIVLVASTFGSPLLTRAKSTAAEIQAIKDEIANHKAEAEAINAKLDEYRQKITQYANQAKSLTSDVAFLENDIAVTELEISSARNEIDSLQLEINLLDEEMVKAENHLAEEKSALKDTLFSMYIARQKASVASAVLDAEKFTDLFSELSALDDLSRSLKVQITATKTARQQLDTEKGKRETAVGKLQATELTLSQKQKALEEQKIAKEILIAQTQESESQYQSLLKEVRSEQAAIQDSIDQLEADYANKLREADGDSTETVISWPVQGIITTLFHDPTYPFRYLFEHSGLDIAIPQGTPVQAAAPGIVAWAKTGTMYGNYVMIIHSNGYATLYAHMSRMDVVQDQFVTRGQIIGLSGGRKGSAGAGFSTGPHLHFEVRLDGIPVDPMQYLPK